MLNNYPLKIIPLGGTTTVQKNMYIYEWQDEIVAVDCGVGFPDITTPGVDIIIPDFTYLLENKHKVKGVVITHGHDDHRSSIPFLLKEHPFNIYAAPFVKGLIEKSLEEHNDLKTKQINAFDIDSTLTLGNFRFTPFRVNHSIPDTLGFAIDTPQGRVFHCADFKFDWSPVMGKPFDIQKAAVLASQPQGGVLALLSDCLGSTTEGYSTTERIIQTTFEQILEQSTNQQVFITTISSNISRIQQAIAASLKFRRKVVLSGRSIRDTISVAREFGYIDFPDSIFVDEKDAFRHKQNQLTYIITGSYGQPRSGLVRLALGEHKTIKLQKNAAVIFSADPIPNTVSAVNFIIDELYLKGAQIYYSEIQDNLHVSGHGIKGDLTLMANIVRPKYFVPIGGTVKHMRAYSEMIQELGVDQSRIFELLDGQTLIFENGSARLGERIKVKEVYVDGTLVGDVGYQVLGERLQMANNGMAVVTISNKKVSIVTRGFVFIRESIQLIEAAKRNVNEIIQNNTGKSNRKILERRIEQSLKNFFFKETGREPLIVVYFE